MAELGTSCDGDDECISGYEEHVAANDREEDDLDRDEQESREHRQTEAAEIEIVPEAHTSMHGDEMLRPDDQNEAMVNASNSLLIPDVENELKYGQDRATGNTFENDDMDDHADDDNNRQADGERTKNLEEQDEVKEDEIVLTSENEEQSEQAPEREEKGKDDDDASDRNSFHVMIVNRTATEAGKTTSATTVRHSIQRDVNADVVEKYDFDTNNFIVETPSYSATDNTTNTPPKSKAVEDNLFNQYEDSEITDSSLPIRSDNNELSNLIRQHTEYTGKQHFMHENPSLLHKTI